ncbi:translation initiation factor IF-3 [Candidatus Nardonella dryophthoridicola]|uniref:Translation initiation factor IF-3 n=1 Tax=endosymbiont of Rhynchophorus ferrugineus TaxID=1972133 RepID=A0A2Z5T411_9GAMM|nr:translation initiation factor IF-3 [Candidatus Nardonella dryophthoridicola]QTJ62881.1 translation initiation factor IF-3 [Candidatus Nardonella dryophthoridicola]BBA85127.1 translation initiation factor IF-3 [endosymbiont of Rhynchophorus ferrugineus]
MKFSKKNISENKIIRLIDFDGKQIGLIDKNKAIIKAKEKKLDLILLNPNLNPAVYKIGDYGKHIYNKSKNIKNIKNKNILKEIKMNLNIKEYDYNIKLNKIIFFLKKGNKVKITIKIKGREIVHKNIGIEIIKKICKSCENIAIIENKIKISVNKEMNLNLIPKKKCTN